MIKILFLIFISISVNAELIKIDKGIYEVWYDSELEQPVKVTYFVKNRPSTYSRKGINFYKEKSFHTSDDEDYYKNIWDKGHMAPAIHFSDTEENLYKTYSYLNAALQHKSLNRGAWRDLESNVKKWSSSETLYVENKIVFNKNSKVLKTGATVPSGFQKNIYFQTTKKTKCFYFPNKNTKKSWLSYEKDCDTELLP
tara:strand:+ start:431 stop:1021 length:591 start_codon:yes stop_codon:yes gene_type:complete